VKPAHPDSRVAVAVCAVALGAILWATLSPTAPPEHATEVEPWVRWLAPSVADLARNVVLFLPIGLGLALAGVGRARVALLCLALTLVVEGTQILLPGRTPSPWDVLANTLGGLAGAGLLGHGRRIARDRAHPSGAAIPWLASAGFVVLVGGGAVLFTPAPAPPPLYGHRHPTFEEQDRYPGEVRSVRVGERALTSRRLEDEAFWSGAIEAGRTIRIEATTAPASGRLSPLAAVSDRDMAIQWVVAVQGRDVVFARRRGSERVGLDPPMRWARDVLPPLPPRAPSRVVEIEVEPRGADLCIGVDGALRCGLGFHLREGWMHWLPAYALPAALHPLVGWLWLAGPGVLLGFYGMRNVRSGLGAAFAVAVALVVASRVQVLPASALEIAALGLSAGLGASARWALQRPG
jgi:VanZ family protein